LFLFYFYGEKNIALYIVELYIIKLIAFSSTYYLSKFSVVTVSKNINVMQGEELSR